ncbi:MAG: UDP-N-acetylglucosamine 2-epimerase (non-hydrolyzing) [Methanogenium sp.]|nr:UDP-N-acetylglucosamine 2-epimerase (non-hydrolyzing) [Methanogenium sp.]
MKIVSIVGVRPQFIKCAPVSREVRKEHEVILVHTGQHYDANMSYVFFEQLNIPKPDYNLDIGSGSQGEQTGKMLIEIEKVLLKEQPDMVLVYGDTNSTLAGALAAAKMYIPVAPVEAGLRSFDRTMPEEINRVMTDHLSDLLFCPTQSAVDNLAKEGITKENGNGVYLTGDVMVDALKYNIGIAKEKSDILDRLNLIIDTKGNKYSTKGPDAVSKQVIKTDKKIKDYYVATIHQASNTDSKENLTNIIKAFSEIIIVDSSPILFPVHPRTVKCLKEYNLYDRLPENLIILAPLPYLDMLLLMSNAKKILTDSGGIQKEAYILKRPCITLRENTEWVETIEDGFNVLTGADKGKITSAVLDNKIDLFSTKNRFGNGDAAEKMISRISSFNN